MQPIKMFPAGGFEAGHIDQLWTRWLEMGGSCQGEIMEVVHERASRGFFVPFYGESCACLVIRVTYIYIFQSANDKSDGQQAVVFINK